MLVSTKDQGLGRRRRSYSHSHVYSMSKLARSSKLSLLSAISTQSNGSNGSNSTVTQESYNRSKSDTSRKRRTRRRKEPPRPDTAPMEAVEEAISEGEEPRSEVDVFEFLVEDDSHEAKDAPTATNRSATEDSHDHHTSPHSLNSDSGISMDDGSIVLGKATLRPLIPAASDQQGVNPRKAPEIKFGWALPEVPKPTHSTVLPAEPAPYWDGFGHHFPLLENEPGSPYAFSFDPEDRDSRRHSFSTYEKLTAGNGRANLQTTNLPARGFTHTCQRLLLDLQRTITDLEDEHRRLEAYCDQVRQQSPAGTNPASRRGSWQSTPTELMPLKADLSAQLQMKLAQYYKLLLLSQKIEKLKAKSPIQTESVANLRAFLSEGTAQSDFGEDMLLKALEDEEDLITLPSAFEQSRAHWLQENIGRLVLGATVVLSAILMQVTGSWKVKGIAAVQILGSILALCMPRNRC